MYKNYEHITLKYFNILIKIITATINLIKYNE